MPDNIQYFNIGYTSSYTQTASFDFTYNDITYTFQTQIFLEKRNILRNGGYYTVKMKGRLLYPSGTATANQKIYSAINYNLSNGQFSNSGGNVGFGYSYSSSMPSFETIVGVEQGAEDEIGWFEFPLSNDNDTIVFLTQSNTVYSVSGQLNFVLNIFDSINNTAQIVEFSELTIGSSTITTFGSMPAIQNPINVYPNNATIDATDPLDVRFVFFGEKLSKYVLRYRLSNDIYQSEDVITGTSLTPIYNGEEVNISIPENTFANNHQYVFQFDLYAEDDETQIPFTTIEYYFEAYSKPTITLTPSPIDDVFSLSTKTLNLSGVYSQAQNIGIKYYTFELYSAKGELIDTTDKIYSANIKYHYDGFLPNSAYKLLMVIETAKQQILQREFTIEVNYNPKYNFKYPIECKQEESDWCEPEQYISLQWAKDIYATAIVQGNVTLNTTTHSADIGSESNLIYNQISGQKLQLSDDFGIGFQTTITGETADICTIHKDSETYKVFMDKGVLKHQINNNTPEAFAGINIQEYVFANTTPTPNKIYMWASDSANKWFSDSSHIWRTEGQVDLFITINRSNGVVTFTAEVMNNG